MNTRVAWLLCAALAVCAAAPAPGQVLEQAAHTAQTLHRRLGRAYAPLLGRAKAVLIAPEGAGGDAVLVLHTRGGWSEPAFFDAAALEARTPSVLLIMSERALNTVLRQQGLAPAGPPLSLAAVGAKTGAELLLWPAIRPRLNDAGFHQDDAANALWYGHARGAAEIVGGTAPELRSSRLRGVLGQV